MEMDDEKAARKREKMRRLQRERPDPAAEYAARKAREEQEAVDRRAAEEQAARRAQAEQEAAAAAARAQADRIRREEEAEDLRLARLAERERRLKEEALAEAAKRVMFGRHTNFGTNRASSVSQGSYTRYRLVVDNWRAAQQARAEKTERLALKEAHATGWSERGRQHAIEQRLSHKQSRRLRKELEERSRRQAREARKLFDARRHALQKQRAADLGEMRERVRQASQSRPPMMVMAVSSSLGGHPPRATSMAHEAHVVQQRKEGKQRREQVARAVEHMRERLREDKLQVVCAVRREGAHAGASTQVLVDATERANEVREAERLWRSERRKAEDGYIRDARETRVRTRAQREQAKAAVAESLEERRLAADDFRSLNDGMAAHDRQARRDKQEQLNSTVAEAYRARFVSKVSADAYDDSDWMQLTAWYRSPDSDLDRVRGHDPTLLLQC